MLHHCEVYIVDNADRVQQRQGNLQGGDGDDRIYGYADNDTIDGGIGTDRCDGGTGFDTALRCETILGIP